MTAASEPPKPVTAYCRTCGKPLTEDTVRVAQGTVFCEEHAPKPQPEQPVGSPYASHIATAANSGVSPGMAFLVGLIPGVGAIYNGQYAKGVVHVLVLGLLISIISSSSTGGLEPLFGMLMAVFYFYMPFEAYHTARKRMLGESVEEFSSLVNIDPRRGASPVIPILLIIFGVLFLLNNLGWLYLAQVLRYWPVILIVAGGWMLYARLKPDHTSPESGGGE